ncbi:hypothetical protein [Motilimonas sp. E26]|uniref:hypothetical protein n=1 Tax=Motilimonas sp. E26 TaxID=2865674 RepID=UPI001E5498DE|nr:hypothetical protein [Motilimonas sp. E26]MCE0559025.1 hypothetical protein [Motilimonas sp. E26]
MRKIKELKINNYKKKLLDKYFFLNVVKISYGDEDSFDLEFCKSAHNSNGGVVTRFNFYDGRGGKVADENFVFSQARKMMKEKLILFKGYKNIVFTVIYGGESFRVKCCVNEFIRKFDEIEGLREYPIIFEENHNVILSLIRLEYEIELYCWKSNFN